MVPPPPPTGTYQTGRSADGTIEPGTFLEKRSYRRRRLTDGLRLLPLLGVWLFMVPLFWPTGEGTPPEQAVSMSDALTFVFVVWSVLTVIAALLVAFHGGVNSSAASDEEGL